MPKSDDAKWDIPEKFRASLDISDEAAYALLQKADEEQKALGAKINAPFTQNTPTERSRSKAFITIQNLLQVKQSTKLHPDQVEMLAEAYAAVGRYDLASEATKTQKKLYKAIWKAIFLPDDAWCSHSKRHKYVKENIFSINHGREVPLLACNECGMMNVADTPDEIASRSAYRRQWRGQTRGMTIEEAKAFHEENVRKG